ncbi:hypothetical protein CRYUN_Cryun02cG0000900 [Craigia yunnanensis]
MTIDDDSSVYVGGLPYDATEASIRRVFSLYGAVVAVKIVNDHTTRGKFYGFVTFTNPRSAYDAINDMNGRTIDGRVVRVNEVTTRGGRSNFSRDRSRQSDRDRAGIEKEIVIVIENGIGIDIVIDRDHDRDVEDNVQEEIRDHIQDWERDHELNLDQDREIAGTNGYHISVDEDKEQQLRRWNGSMSNDQHGRGLSSDSSDDYNQMKKELERSVQSREELKTEISLMEGRLEERQQIVLDLQKKSKTLEDALVAAKKLSSRRKIQLTKSLVDSAMVENENAVAVQGGSLANGMA